MSTPWRHPHPSPQVSSSMLMAWLPWGLPAPHSPGTYSDTCTKMSSVPFSGVINPWPWERENCLQTPLKMGPAEARAVLQEKREDFSLVALAQVEAQGEIFAMNMTVPGRVQGTHPQHSGQGRAVQRCQAPGDKVLQVQRVLQALQVTNWTDPNLPGTYAE